MEKNVEKLLQVEDMYIKNMIKKFKNVHYQEDKDNTKIDNFKLSIIESDDISKDIKNNKINKLNSEIDNIIEAIIDMINSQKKSLKKWNDIKNIII